MRFSGLFIIIGVVTPALLSLFFIFHFGINTVYWDEWGIIPTLKSYLTGQPWVQNLFVQSNENHPVFPHLIILGLAYFTSYNTFYEMLIGWAFLSFTVYILWRLLLQTFPQGKWIIIPIAWQTYSFLQLATFLFGSASIAWYLAILMTVLAIYFLNIKNSTISIIAAIVCGIIASFSIIVGLLVWLIGLLSFKENFRWKFLTLFVISGITAFVLYFNGWTDRVLNHTPAFTSNPVGFVNFVMAFLGNVARIPPHEFVSQISFSIYVGIGIIGIFIVMNLLYHHFQIGRKNNQNARPWVQIAIFGILSSIMAAAGRLEFFGEGEALSSRYVPLSNFFLDGTLVITLMVLLYLKQIANTQRNINIMKGSIVFLLILVSFEVGVGDVYGWIAGSFLHNMLVTGTSCLLTFESASDDCLQILYPDAKNLKEQAKFLQEFCLGPFASNCK